MPAEVVLGDVNTTLLTINLDRIGTDAEGQHAQYLLAVCIEHQGAITECVDQQSIRRQGIKRDLPVALRWNFSVGHGSSQDQQQETDSSHSGIVSRSGEPE